MRDILGEGAFFKKAAKEKAIRRTHQTNREIA